MPDSHVVNTVLLAIVLPVLAYVAVLLHRLNDTLGRLDVALSGYKGKGGALAEIVSLRRRVHRIESVASALMVHTGIEVPDIKPEG